MTLLTSPTGEIQFMAVVNPVPKSKGSEEKVFTVKIAYDNKKDAKWLSQISDINDAKVVTADSYRGKDKAIKALLATGKSLVSAVTKFQPTVYDAAGNEIEAPMFFVESTGTAQMIVEPYKGDKGGTINLVGVIVHSIESPETSSSTGEDRQEALARIRAQLREAAELAAK